MGEAYSPVETVGIVSDTEWRTFWISYNYGYVEAGEGFDVGSNRFLAWDAVGSPLPISALSVSTTVGVEAEWEFSQLGG